MNKNKMHFLVGLISCTFMSTAIVLCLTNFKVSKLNACPSQDSKFLSLTERSLEQCVEECARKKSCEVVGYKRSFRLCEIHVDSPSPDVDDNRCVMIKKTDMSGPPSKCTNCGEWSACDEETGHCSREECPLLTTVANGTVLGNMNDFGAKKIVRCNTGFFEITGTHSVKCSAKGEWTPRYDRNPHCQKCPGAEQMIQFPPEQESQFPLS
ncbi:uncharacterized protein LOC123555541 [Mercenaria mercenaria]|uniref:uncharacterized protein LOC123555541 n=1 Tax=Mercenaria mercenaria TaxID=6596 RepID=UPI00234F3D9F|nr:uncharacterized protein LOC123555541 [Mercenaria mercenaria]